MATVTYFTDLQSDHRLLGGQKGVIERKIDFSENNVSAADVVQVAKVLKNCLVTKVYTVIVTAEGAACTATVGDGATADGWDASINLNAAAGTVTHTLEATDTFVGGKFYTAADTIDITMGHDTDTAVVIFFVEYVMSDLYSVT